MTPGPHCAFETGGLASVAPGHLAVWTTRLFDAQQERGRQSTSWETFEGLHEVYVVGNGVRFHVLEVDITDIDVLS